MLRVLVVDDEVSARRRTQAMLREIDGVTAVGEAADVEEALAAARETRPDLILLDIDMPGASGLDLVGRLDRADPPAIVFVTAFDAFAVEAFGLAATDYLLKPVPLDRLRAAVERVRRARAASAMEDRLAEMEEVVATLRRGMPRTTQPSHVDAFWIMQRGARLRVAVDDVRLIEAEHDHVRLHTAQRSYLLRDRIGRIEAALDPAAFVRIHRSLIVRRALVQAVRQRNPGVYGVVMDDGAEHAVGRKYSGGVRAMTQQMA